MTLPTIPESREGYALDQPTVTVHRRWAAHARGLPRVRSVREVVTWLGPNPVPCAECWPPVVPPAPPKPARAARAARATRATRARRVIEVDVAAAEQRAEEQADQAVEDEEGEPASQDDESSIEREAEDMPEAAPEEVQE